jgi:hypothetical protein
MCDEAEIATTKGTVIFNQEGRSISKTGTQAGTQFRATIEMTSKDYQECLSGVRAMIVPPEIIVTVNGEALSVRFPIKTTEASLRTQLADADGKMRDTRRKTNVEIYTVSAGQDAWIFELGIPVVETGDKYDVNVCVAPETRILTSDLRYIPASDIVVGMNLVGFDEERTGHRRQFRSSKVLNINVIRRPSYRLIFEDGTQVVCSSDHQWLCLRHGGNTGHGRTSQWKTTSNMIATAGNRPGSCVAKPLDVWNIDEDYSGGYLAAAFDGEGSILQKSTSKSTARCQVLYTQCQNIMLDQVRDCLKKKNIIYREHLRNDNNINHKTVTNLYISNRANILHFLGQCRPRKLLERFNIDIWGTIPTRIGVRLIKKEFIGEQTVIAIETSTHTYIAEGLASHNCQKVPLTMDRTNVQPAFLKDVRIAVAEAMINDLDQEDANANWVRTAVSDPDASTELVTKVFTERFGEKTAIFDPTDAEANARAVAAGYTLVHGKMLSKDEWVNVKKAEIAQSSGKMFPTFPETGEGESSYIEDWTPEMQAMADWAVELGYELMGVSVVVKFNNNRESRYLATYTPLYRMLTFNLGNLDKGFCARSRDDAKVISLLIHEFAHQYVSNHLSDEYTKSVCDLAAKCVRLALAKPELFRASKVLVNA